MSDNYQTIVFEQNDRLARVMLNRPDKLNAMNPAFFEEIRDVFERIHQEAGIRAVVLSGNGRHFSSGLDLVEAVGAFQGQGGSAEQDSVFRVILELQESFNRVADCRKPVIAAVHGACIGGGLDLVAACDIRLASADAVFSLREARMGMIADLGSLQRLPAIIGEGNTRELAFTGADIDAERALAMGLISRVLPDREACLSAAEELALEIADAAPLAVQGAKDVLNYCRDKSVKEGLEYVAARNCLVLRSDDVVEAFKAFMQKRDPEFKGK